MTTNNLLRSFVSIVFHSYGHHTVKFEIRGKEKSAITRNVGAVDRIKFRGDYPSDKCKNGSGYTLHQALECLRDTVIAENYVRNNNQNSLLKLKVN